MRTRPPKDPADVVNAAIAAGCTYVPPGRRKHPKLILPDGTKFTIPGSSSDWRAGRNLVRDLRKRGVQL